MFSQTTITGHSFLRRVTKDGLVLIEKSRPEPHVSVFDMQRRNITTERKLQEFASTLQDRTGKPVADQPVGGGSETLLLTDRTSWLMLLDSKIDQQVLADLVIPLAETFAAVHTAELDYVLEPARLEIFPTWPVDAERWHLLSIGLEELLAHVHSLGIVKEIKRVADELAAGDTFVHADAKPDNVLMSPDCGSVRLIDWENAGLARLEADLSSLLGGLLYHSVATPSYNEESIPWNMIGENGHAVLQTVKAVLQNYALITGLLPDARLIAQGCGLSLLCRSFVHVESSGSFDRIPRLLVKISSRLLCRPDLFDHWLRLNPEEL